MRALLFSFLRGTWNFVRVTTSPGGVSIFSSSVFSFFARHRYIFSACLSMACVFGKSEGERLGEISCWGPVAASSSPPPFASSLHPYPLSIHCNAHMRRSKNCATQYRNMIS